MFGSCFLVTGPSKNKTSIDKGAGAMVLAWERVFGGVFSAHTGPALAVLWKFSCTDRVKPCGQFSAQREV